MGATAPPPDMVSSNFTLNLAYAAFCGETDLMTWTCHWCAGSGANVELLAFLTNSTAGTQGYVGLDREHGRVIVSFRGSDNMANDIEDGVIILQTPRNLGHVPTPSNDDDLSTVLVHSGFDFAYGSVRNATQAAVRSGLDACGSACNQVLFTGHSLGAAMTTLAAVDFAASLAESKYAEDPEKSQAIAATSGSNITIITALFTFGSPRVGNTAFAAWAGSILNGNTSARVTRQGDVVPRIPPNVVPLRDGQRYQHVHTEELWNRHNGTASNDVVGEYDWLVACMAPNGEDPDCADSEPPASLVDPTASGCGQHCNYLGIRGGYC